MRPTKALTLVETVMTVGLMFLVVSTFLSVIVWARGTWLVTTDQATARQELYAAARRLTAEVQRSVPSSFTSLDSQAFAFATAYSSQDRYVTDDATGEPVWQAYLIYYLPDKEHRLMRKRFVPTSSDALTRLKEGQAMTASELQSALSGLSSATQLCEGVDDFDVTVSGHRVTAHLEARIQGTQGEVNVVSLDPIIRVVGAESL